MKKLGVVLLTFFIVVLCVFFLRKDMTVPYEVAIEKYQTEHSNYLDWRGIKLHYIDRGEGPVILLFHGFAGSFTNWDKLVEVMPPNYRIIIPDLPGLGLSQFPEVGEDEDLIEMYCDFSKTIIEELDLDSVAVIGNSLGGFLSWETALRNEDRVSSLVLLNSAGYDIADTDAFFIKFSKTKMFKQIVKKGAPKFIAKTAAKRCLGDPSKIDPSRVDDFHGLLNKEGNLEAVARLGSSNQMPDSLRIAKVNVPTLIVWGDLDNIVPVEHAYKFNRDIPNSKLLIYEGSGHVPMIENSERLRDDILQFWASIKGLAVKE